MRRRLYRAAVIGAGLSLTLSFGSAGIAQAASTPHWRLVHEYRFAHSSVLRSVTVISRADAWAVGNAANAPLVVRWNGTRWARVPVPRGEALDPASVSASSARNVWVLGFSLTGGVSGPPEALRWNGSAWAKPATPVPSDVSPYAPVVARGPSDVWAIGASSCAGTGNNALPCHTVLYHYDGATWKPFTVPTLITSMSGTAAGGVWASAAGGLPLQQLQNAKGRYRLAGYRWTGTAWRRIASMPHLLCKPFAASIAMRSARDVWVSGVAHAGAFALAWNGRRWTQHIAPTQVNGLTLAATGPLALDGHAGVWLGPWAHFTGHRWVRVETGSWNRHGAGFLDLAAVPGGATMWSVGGMYRNARGRLNDAFVAVFGHQP